MKKVLGYLLIGLIFLSIGIVLFTIFYSAGLSILQTIGLTLLPYILTGAICLIVQVALNLIYGYKSK